MKATVQPDAPTSLATSAGPVLLEVRLETGSTAFGTPRAGVFDAIVPVAASAKRWSLSTLDLTPMSDEESP